MSFPKFLIGNPVPFKSTTSGFQLEFTLAKAGAGMTDFRHENILLQEPLPNKKFIPLPEEHG
jgi:hypothetical protein